MLRAERETGTRRTSGARIGNPAEPSQHGVFPSNAWERGRPARIFPDASRLCGRDTSVPKDVRERGVNRPG